MAEHVHYERKQHHGKGGTRWYRRLGRLLVATANRCFEDNTPRLAAGLAFYTLLSLAPSLFVIVAVAGAVVGRQSAEDQFLGWITTTLNAKAATYVQGIIDQTEAGSNWATVAGLASMFFGATLAFGALHDSLGLIWRDRSVEEEREAFRQMVGAFVLKRLVSFLAAVLVGVLLLVLLLLSAAITAIGDRVPEWLPLAQGLLQAIDIVISLGMTTALIAVLFRLFQPRRVFPTGENSGITARTTDIRWTELWVGAFVTSVGFVVGKTAIGWYLGVYGWTSAYGAAGTLVFILLWIYYSAQILLFGAEFTGIYARGRRLHR